MILSSKMLFIYTMFTYHFPDYSPSNNAPMSPCIASLSLLWQTYIMKRQRLLDFVCSKSFLICFCGTAPEVDGISGGLKTISVMVWNLLPLRE